MAIGNSMNDHAVFNPTALALGSLLVWSGDIMARLTCWRITNISLCVCVYCVCVSAFAFCNLFAIFHRQLQLLLHIMLMTCQLHQCDPNPMPKNTRCCCCWCCSCMLRWLIKSTTNTHTQRNTHWQSTTTKCGPLPGNVIAICNCCWTPTWSAAGLMPKPLCLCCCNWRKVLEVCVCVVHGVWSVLKY